MAPPAGLAPVAAPEPAPEPMARVASPGGGPGDGSLVPSALAAMAKGFKDQRRSVVYLGSRFIEFSEFQEPEVIQNGGKTVLLQFATNMK